MNPQVCVLFYFFCGLQYPGQALPIKVANRSGSLVLDVPLLTEARATEGYRSVLDLELKATIEFDELKVRSGYVGLRYRW
jgi:hypothetical protein